MIQQVDLVILPGLPDVPRDPIFLRRSARQALRRMMDKHEPASPKLGRAADKRPRLKAAIRRASLAEPIEGKQMEMDV